LAPQSEAKKEIRIAFSLTLKAWPEAGAHLASTTREAWWTSPSLPDAGGRARERRNYKIAAQQWILYERKIDVF
jgi:hypothetical protein